MNFTKWRIWGPGGSKRRKILGFIIPMVPATVWSVLWIPKYAGEWEFTWKFAVIDVVMVPIVLLIMHGPITKDP